MEQPANNKENELQEHTPKESIQQAFKRFQKEKFYQLKLNKYLKAIEVDRTAPEFKKQLRQKLLLTAHKYIGVPYAKKFHNPGDSLFNAPLFLDCCALIRQCVFDLRGEFGYTLAKWNQAYQLDLLPDEGKTESDLQPGDLIFYSATYNNPKLKAFPHSMVHVEIYMGEGRSIGARWQKGTIQIFDSYKFQSTLYHDIKFHYRSIDKWLQGIFQSHCQQHKWLDERSNEWLSDRFSVFADPTLQDAADLTLIEEGKWQVRQVMVGKGNNSQLIKDYFLGKDGYNLMSAKEQFSPHYFFKWVQSAGEIDFHSFKEGLQIVNHIPNISMVSAKLELLRTLREWEMEIVRRGRCPSLSVAEFTPKTFRLDLMSDQIQFMNDYSSGIWIYKPRNLNQGRGIRIIADIATFKAEFIRSKKFYLGEFSLNNMLQYNLDLAPQSQQTDKYGELKHDGLIQHYIRPLLLNRKKFDIRCYLLVNSQPELVLFNEGYLRMTLQDYTEEGLEDEHSLMVHLTNNCFQKKHKLYKQRKDESIATWLLLEKEVGCDAIQGIRHRIKRILLAVYAAARRKLIAKKGTYQLLGCDIIIDKAMKPYLLEVNTNPAMFTDTTVQKQLLPGLARNTLDIVLALFEGHSVSSILDKAANFGYEPIYCPQCDFAYGSSGVREWSCDEEKTQEKHNWSKE